MHPCMYLPAVLVLFAIAPINMLEFVNSERTQRPALEHRL